MKTHFFALIMSILTLVSCAQTKSFTLLGTVTNATDRSPLVGVSINIKGTATGTKTDINGKYRLKIKTDDRLVFVFVGYNSYETKIKKDTLLNVALQADTRVLNEMIVVGHYKIAREPMLMDSRAEIIMSKSSSASPMNVSDTEAEEMIALPAIDKANMQARTLTAGEWNDLANWDFWQNLMRENQWAAMQEHWQMFTNQKLKIVLKDKKGKPANGISVELWTNNKLEWTAQTDVFGEAVLWNNLFETTKNEVQNMVVKIKNNAGQELKNWTVQDKNATQNVILDTPAPVSNVVDIMFVVDATGSMGDEINYLKSELEDIISKVQSTDSQGVIRLGMAFYRDHGDEYLVRNFDFTTNIKQVQSDLNQQSAGGGGDFEEAVDEALDNAISQQRWNATATTRLLFLILDAPPHHDPQRIKTIQKNMEAAARKGIKIIPVVASGIDKNTEFLMRMTAQATNGTYVFLTDDSGVGNAHLKPTIGSYQVEYLNNLILRLIKKYSLAKAES